MINNITRWLDNTYANYPDKIAVVDECGTITFRGLREKAICLANSIIKRGIYKRPIAVCIDKSCDTIVAFMAVAYSGNFYTVIDSTMPEKRVERIFETLEPAIVISDSDRVFNSIDVINIKKFDFNNDVMESDVLKVRDATCDGDLLYTLFTSGSTGIPKGVTITHRSVVDYIDWVVDEFNFTQDDVLGNQAPFFFDNSILDIYTSIKSGATLNIIPHKLFIKPVALLEYIDKSKINTIFWVPSALILVANLRALKKVDLSNRLKRILFCGEVMPVKQLNEWMKYVPDAVYANLYGPTEIADACTFYIVNRKFEDGDSIPIGKPIPNTDIIVLNENNELVKGEEIGELCVRGVSLSLGYYNNKEKTSEVFVQNPLNDKYIEYIYRTGDLVKYNEYGELMYIARKDFQIKHSGHRIELGEIESATTALDGVERCCCVYDERKQKIILIIQGDISKECVLSGLNDALPEYMIPARIEYKDSMPLNANGKVDRVILKQEYCE